MDGSNPGYYYTGLFYGHHYPQEQSHLIENDKPILQVIYKICKRKTSDENIKRYYIFTGGFPPRRFDFDLELKWEQSLTANERDALFLATAIMHYYPEVDSE